MRDRRPSIYRIGQIDDDGDTVTITGWGLGLCSARCTCHRHPLTMQLVISQNATTGTLGLACFRRPCDCCEHWTADELAAIVCDLETATAWQAADA